MEHEAQLLASCLTHYTFFSRDRKSTRLNSSHLVISYAVFCLKKKKLVVHRNANVRTSVPFRPSDEDGRLITRHEPTVRVCRRAGVRATAPGVLHAAVAVVSARL